MARIEGFVASVRIVTSYEMVDRRIELISHVGTQISLRHCVGQAFEVCIMGIVDSNKGYKTVRA